MRDLAGLHAIAELGIGRFIITPNQNLVLADIPSDRKAEIAALLRTHGLDAPVSGLRRNALACVALPTCGLALAESERYLPDLMTRLEDELERVGLAQDDITIRMTGCPNGCARPYLAEIGLVGRSPGLYNLYLGGAFDGARMNKLYRRDVGGDAIVAALAPLFRDYAEHRAPARTVRRLCDPRRPHTPDDRRQHIPRRSRPRTAELTMRSLRQTIPYAAWPSLRDARGRLLGLPFVLAAFVPGFVLGWQACLAALMIASLASFLVYVPLTVLALNGGGALTEDAPAPALTRAGLRGAAGAMDDDRVAWRSRRAASDLVTHGVDLAMPPRWVVAWFDIMGDLEVTKRRKLCTLPIIPAKAGTQRRVPAFAGMTELPHCLADEDAKRQARRDCPDQQTAPRAA